MTARIQDEPLERVLHELARRVPLTVSIQGSVARDPVSVRFRSLPVEEGIRKVLEGKEYAIIYKRPPSLGTRHGEHSSVREIIVFSAHGGGTYDADTWLSIGGGVRGPSRPAPSTPRPSTSGGETKPGNLILQLEEMSHLADEDELLPVLARALEDQDVRVRAKAMEVLEDTLGPIPVRQLAHIAGTERDPLMRSRALTLLAFRAEGNAGQALTRALQDPDADVRELAADLLNQLGLPAPAPPPPLTALP